MTPQSREKPVEQFRAKSRSLKGPTPMNDQCTARIRAHQQNLDRYCRPLAVGDLSELERKFLHKRIAEERTKLERLQSTANLNTGFAFVAAWALAKN
jgi:hypothetical protein